jgi:hypothetical protein
LEQSLTRLYLSLAELHTLLKRLKKILQFVLLPTFFNFFFEFIKLNIIILLELFELISSITATATGIHSQVRRARTTKIVSLGETNGEHVFTKL